MEQINLNLIPGRAMPVCHVSQYDVDRTIRCNLFEGDTVFALATGDTAEVHVRKPDDTVVTASLTVVNAQTYLDIKTTQQMDAVAGSNLCEIQLTRSGATLGTLNFIMEVEADPMDGGAIGSQSEIRDLQAQVDAAVAVTMDGIESNLDKCFSFAEGSGFTIQQSDIESGVWAYTTKSANSNRLRSKNLLPVKKGMIVTYTNPNLEIYFGVAKTQTSGSTGFKNSGWIAKGATNGFYRIPQDGYMTFNVRKNPDGAIAVSDYDCVVTISVNSFVDRDAAIFPFNTYNVLALNNEASDTKSNDVYYYFNNDGCHVKGHASALSFANIYNNTSALPKGLTPGVLYYAFINSSSANIRLTMFFYSNGASIQTVYATTKSKPFIIDSSADGAVIRLEVLNGTTADEHVTFGILSLDEMGIITKSPEKYINNGALTLSDIKENGLYTISTLVNVTDAPPGLTVTALKVEKYKHNGFIKQTVANSIAPATNKIYYRFSDVTATAWSNWIEQGQGNINNYTFNEYANTYNISSSPTITTDTNSYLAPTGDTTDRTADIVAMLSATGVCRLGKGDYYVENLEMPRYTSIVGCGNGTRIYLKGNNDGFAIKMNTYCTVKDLQIYGSSSSITPSSTLGNRHGILWQGNYTQDQTAPYMSMVLNVFIGRFSGGGITCYDTGYGTINALEVVNVYISNCGAGINISYWSEFNKFTNVRAGYCYYGCINNGGNNDFVNCDFSSNTMGFLMDNSQGQSPNNSHGSVVGCIFNHSDNNTGIGIKILNCKNGFTFTGCQIFYSKIHIEDAEGVVVADSIFGNTNCDITIYNGGAVLFANNMHSGAPTITVLNNTATHFVNCYVKSTGAAVQP